MTLAMELQATNVSYRVEKVGQGGLDERRRPVPSALGVSPSSLLIL
jgi:hypothetical protein